MSKTKSITIRKSTDVDLRTILKWLKEEEDSNGHSFYCNREIIKRAHQGGGLTVLIGKQGEKAIAFALGDRTIDIIAVKESKRGLGYGELLFNYMEVIFREKGVNVLEIECTPETSVPFWERMNFTLYQDEHRFHGQPDKKFAFKVLGRENYVPSDWQSAGVEISFHHEGALYDESFGNPIKVFKPLAGRKNNTVRLVDRVIFRAASAERDAVVVVKVDGKEIYKDKAKYPEAAACGVLKDSYGAFFVDEVTTGIKR